MAITLRGEEGKSFDATPILIGDMATGTELNFASLEADTMVLNLSSGFLTAEDLSVPEEGQEISLYLDDRREFAGIVSEVSAGAEESGLDVSVTVAGPMFWLQGITISDVFEGDVERPVFICPKGDLRASIVRFLNRAIDLGVPMQVGQIDALYDTPLITLREGSFAFGLSELLKHVPDAVAWFSYSDAGFPKFNVTRRAPNASQSLRIGIDGVTGFSLKALYKMVVKKVTIPFAENSSTFATQTSLLGEKGGLQVVPLSGDDLLDYEIPEVSGTLTAVAGPATHTVTTRNVLRSYSPNNPNFSDFTRSRILLGTYYSRGDSMIYMWPFYQKLQYDYPPGSGVQWRNAVRAWGSNPPTIGPGYTNSDFPWSSKNFFGLGLKLSEEDGGNLIDGPMRLHAVDESSGPLPSWLFNRLNAKKYRVRGHWVVKIEGNFTEFPDWLLYMEEESVHFSRIVGGSDNNDTWLIFELDFEVTLIDQELNGTEFTESEDLGLTLDSTQYGYSTPPVGYAQNLRDAQSWLPHEGQINLHQEHGTIQRYSGATLNLLGSLPSYGQMGALVQGESINLQTGDSTLNVGPPLRFKGLTAATRFERRPGDNVRAV